MEYVLVQENSYEKAKKQISKNKEKKIIFTSNDDELNRKILEKLLINILLINQAERKDFQKQRNSGLNHVLAKLAKKNNVAIGINFDEIIKSEGNEKAKILARIRQNINLCNKNKLKMFFIVKETKNKRNAYDIKSLELVLGMPTWMTKDLELIVA
ncbi:MAG TPA: RNase P subunit p30 family protein [Candidatus Nanoarchaeia archaeon]|nr:RNase P subunit p30 family protein [Candidatus Nanoarchaeia archaeon]